MQAIVSPILLLCDVYCHIIELQKKKIVLTSLFSCVDLLANNANHKYACAHV